jgi:hypothetical protein
MHLDMFKRVRAPHETSFRLAAPEQGLIQLHLTTNFREKEARKECWLRLGFTEQDFDLFHPSKKPLRFQWYVAN